MQTDGATPAQMVKATEEMASFKKMYQNNFIVVLLTYMEILPVGLLVTLISALFLKRKAVAHQQAS